MTSTEINERILMSARELFAAQGIRKTSLEEVAHGAGVTRMTVYRHYKNKKELTRAVFMQVAQVFAGIKDVVDSGGPLNPGSVSSLFREGLGGLGDRSLLGRFDELKRVYPDIFEEYTAIRKAALDGIFGRVIETIQGAGVLRKGINVSVLRMMFFDTIINAAENPELAGENISRREMIATMQEVFLHGAIDPNAGGSPKSNPRKKPKKS